MLLPDINGKDFDVSAFTFLTRNFHLQLNQLFFNRLIMIETLDLFGVFGGQ
jgi:hypothetical protein